MPYSGLREFLELLESEGELARVRVPVDLNQELGAVCVKSLKNYGPALLFEHPTRGRMPQRSTCRALRRRHRAPMRRRSRTRRAACRCAAGE